MQVPRRKAKILANTDAVITREQLKRRIKAATKADPTIATEAAELVAGARKDHYGDPVKNHTAIGKIWAVLLDLPQPIPPRTVAVMMAALKLVREGGPRGRRDNLVDACGYLLIAEQATPHPDGSPDDPCD